MTLRILLAALAALVVTSSALATDSAVIINEVQFHPANEATQSEWIELRNLHGVDIDLSGWQLEGGVNYTFPNGTILTGRAFLVVAQTPGLLPGVPALGPWTGKLDNGGEEVRLVNNSDRVMDRIIYADDGDWPTGADGSGATLARKIQTAAQSGPAAWAASNEIGGTPGSSNFLDPDSAPKASVPLPIDASTWKYNDTDVAPTADWKDLAFADGAWSTGRSLFYSGSAQLAVPVPATTILTSPGNGLISYWAMDDAVGSTTAVNSVAGSTNGALNGTVGTNVAFTADAAPRSKILRVNMNASNVNVTGSWVAAGNLPAMNLTNSFTWAFWAKSNEGTTNDVILGNRYANVNATDFIPREFIKFTTSQFEWHVNAAGQNLDYADIGNGTWIHHAVVKDGPVLTYFRNGAVSGSVTVSAAPANLQPLFMGGNGANESWSGFLDDVALWNKALPAAAVAALAANNYTPATLPTVAAYVDNGPYPVPPSVVFPTTTTTPLTDDFSAAAIDTGRWEVIDMGLENATVSGLSAAQSGGVLTISGTTTVNYWAGKSLRSVGSYSSRTQVTAEVDRVSFTGTGTAYRSSLWLWADAAHYLHFSQNINEGGWTWNANDTGGVGTLNPTGTGNNLGALDFADAATGAAHMKLVWIPGAYPGQGTIQMWRDSTLAASTSVSNWPSTFRVILTGQGRAAADTINLVFDNASVTVAALQPFQTEVNPATTHYFRNTFNYSGDPSRTTLTLWPIQDDAAVYYLNGTEIHRDNISASPSHGTFASSTVGNAFFPKNPITVPAGVLVSGDNVLAVEVHQDSVASPDMLFGAQLNASELPGPARSDPDLRFTEISGAADASFLMELQNTSAATLNLAGFSIQDSSGHSYLLSGSLSAGAYLALDEATLGFRPVDSARVFLLQGTQLFDSHSVTSRLRGLTSAGHWGYPDTATFGSANVVSISDAIVINEIMYNAPGDSPEEWVEIYNRSGADVDVSGWQFSDGISYEFPAGTPPIPAGGYAVVVWDVAAFNILHAGLPRIFGPFSGGLSSSGERLRLRDANGNLVDETRFAEGGSWPQYTSGEASSIELMNPYADNSNGAAWAASDETSHGAWQTVDYTFPGTIYEVDLNYYSELILGLLNDGEVLIDDLSVRQDPAGTNIELIQNGSFSGGTTDKWRFPGNTRRSVVVDDPDSPGNKVLMLVQGGSLDHMSNHAETTLKNGATLLGAGSLSTGQNYRISFRARWWKGSNALNSHLYFNRGAITTLLTRPTTGGTPGSQNSTYSASATMSIGSVLHSPAVPAAGVAVTVTAKINDPANSTTALLIYSVDEGTEQTVPMTQTDGEWTATIPGEASAAKAVFRIQASNGSGHSAVWPATGMAGRAMVPWEDGQAQLVRPNGCRPHNVRIVLTATDTNLLHAPNNVMSNDWMPCTVIYDEREVYYGTSVHLKGSEHGRAKDVRVGYLLRFGADQLFLGLHDSVAIDRSGAGDQFSQKEILVKRSLNRAGGIPCTEDDIIRVIAPRSQHTGPAIFIHNRLDSDNYLDAQFADGSSGTLFEYELLYPLYSGNVATSTDNGTLEGYKLTQDGPGPPGVAVRKLTPGLSKDEYRWYWLIKNNRSDDNYAGLISGLTALGQSGLNFHTQSAPLLDTDGWLRSFTGPVAWAVADNYAYGAQHNCLYYVQPDGRLRYIPWDMDFTASAGATASVNPNAELGKMINTLAGTTADDINKRTYYGYLLHMVDTAFNPGYLGRWMDHYTCFVNEDYRANFFTFVTTREAYIRTQITSAVPLATFQITTNGGNNYSEPNSNTVLSGDGWVNVSTISLAGGDPLPITWTDQDSWTVTLPVAFGPNSFAIEARDLQGNVIGTDSIVVTGSSAVVPASAANLVVSELHYHPADPTPAEITAGFTSMDDFEWIELQNISADTVNLTGCHFDLAITYTFASGTLIGPGGRLVLPRRAAAFALRNAGVTTAPEYYLAATPTGNQFSNGGEEVLLVDALGMDIKRFSYDDAAPWPTAPDGTGNSLVLISPFTNPDHTEPLSWRSSFAVNGTPGSSEGSAFSGSGLADSDNDGITDLTEFAIGSGQLPSAAVSGPAGGFIITFDHELSTQTELRIEISTDLTTAGPGAWAEVASPDVISRQIFGGTLERVSISIPPPPGGGTRLFVRGKVIAP